MLKQGTFQYRICLNYIFDLTPSLLNKLRSFSSHSNYTPEIHFYIFIKCIVFYNILNSIFYVIKYKWILCFEWELLNFGALGGEIKLIFLFLCKTVWGRICVLHRKPHGCDFIRRMLLFRSLFPQPSDENGEKQRCHTEICKHQLNGPLRWHQLTMFL